MGALKISWGQAGCPDAFFQILTQSQVVEPVGHRDLEDVGSVRALFFGEVERELSPHERVLHVVGAEQQLPGMERTAGRVTYPPVGLDNGLARGEVFFQSQYDVAEDIGEEGLVVLVESQAVAVPVETVDEIHCEVRTPDDAQLTERMPDLRWTGARQRRDPPARQLCLRRWRAPLRR